MEKHDLDGGALLIVVGGAHRQIESERECHHRYAAEPRNGAIGEGEEARRIGEFGKCHRQTNPGCHGDSMIALCMGFGWYGMIVTRFLHSIS